MYLIASNSETFIRQIGKTHRRSVQQAFMFTSIQVFLRFPSCAKAVLSCKSCRFAYSYPLSTVHAAHFRQHYCPMIYISNGSEELFYMQ